MIPGVEDATVSQVAADAATQHTGHLRAWPAILITVAYYFVQFACGALAGVGIVAYCAAAHGRVTRAAVAEALRTAALPIGIVALVAAGGTAFLLTRWVLRGSIREGALRSIGWSSAGAREVFMAALVGASIAVLSVLVLTPLYPPPVDQKWGRLATAAGTGGWQRVAWALLGLFIAPPIEEFVFRGVLWSGLRQSMRAALAGIAVTALFVGSHATEARDYWPAWLTITLVGIATVVLRSRAKSLVPPVALHTSYNATLVLFVYLVSAWQSAAELVRQP